MTSVDAAEARPFVDLLTARGFVPDLGHLTYCTNIHPGATWPEVHAALATLPIGIRRPVVRQRADDFDLLILDIGLPGMDGYEVARRLRTEECCKVSLIIAVSGYGQPEDVFLQGGSRPFCRLHIHRLARPGPPTKRRF